MIQLRKYFNCLVVSAIVLNNSLLIFPFVSPEAKALEVNEAEQILANSNSYDLDHLLVYYKDNPEEPTLVKVDPTSLAAVTIQNRANRNNNLVVQKRDKLENKLNDLLDDPNVEHVQPQYIYTATAWARNADTDTPDDFNSNPSFLTGNHWYYERERVRQMWQDQDCLNAGANCGGDSDTIVAVIDTGLAYENRTQTVNSLWTFVKNDDMFSGSNINLWSNTDETNCGDQIDNDGNGYIDDCIGANTNEHIYCTVLASCTTAQKAEEGHPNDDGGHGTFVTGLIASLVDNAFGSVSPAHNVTIMPIKASFEGQGSFGSFELIEAVDYAMDNGADVINLSLAGPTFDSGLNNKIQEAVAAGVTVVAATGNNNAGVYYPAAFDNVISAGAVTASGTRAFYSNSGSQLDVVAYVGNGGGVGDSVYQRTYACFFNNPNCYSTHNYSTFNNGFGIGTSFAAPQVSGLVALLKGAKPTMSKTGLESKLFSTTTDLGTAGWDSSTGWGAINYEAAYNAVANNVAPTLNIVQPDGVSDNGDLSFNITWTDSDPDDSSTINFFWDTDGAGLNGTAIEECSNISEDSATNNCVFDTRSLNASTYYVYGCVADQINAAVCDYSNGVLNVTHTVKRDWGKVSVNPGFTTVNFTTVFDGAPIVFAQDCSENGTEKVYVNVKDVTSTNFKIQLLENTKTGYDGAHMNEMFCWYAVQSTTATEKAGSTNVNQNWKQITFPTPFAGSPKVFTTVQTENGTDLVYTDVRNVNTNGFEVRLEEPFNWDGNHGFEKVGWIAFEDITDAQEGTSSTANDSTGNTWVTITFPVPYGAGQPPVVLADIISENGSDKINVDIRNITNTSFEYRIEEDPKFAPDMSHSSEIIAWASFTFNTVSFQSGKNNIDSNWVTINFPSPFPAAPKVFSSIATENNTDTADVDIRNVTTTGFDARIEEDPKAWDGVHPTETISWYASVDPIASEKMGTAAVSPTLVTIPFGTTFASVPVVFADIQTNNGNDTINVDIKNVTTSSFQIRIEEDVKVGWDGGHAAETVAWIAFLPATPPVGKAASLLTTSTNWMPVTFTPAFSTVPKLITDVQSEVGMDSIITDNKNLTINGFEIRIEEEKAPFYDGVHANETVAWWAWE